VSVHHKYASLKQYMDVNGQLNAPNAIPPVSCRGAQSMSECGGEEEIQPGPEIEPRSSSHLTG
jgi:hypothetical protein